MNIHSRIVRFFCFFVFAFFLGSCAQVSKPSLTQTSSQSCLQPEIKIAFPLDKGEDLTAPPRALPSPPWQPNIAIPDVRLRDVPYRDTIEFSRDSNGSIELWVLRLISRGLEGGGWTNSLLILDTNEGEWQEISDAFKGFSEVISALYLGNNGEVWAIGLKHSTTSPSYLPQDQRTIGVYDEKANKFRTLIFSEKIPAGRIIYDPSRDLFWAFEMNQAIYSINPRTLEIRRLIDFPILKVLGQESVAISADGNIYILNARNLEKWTQTSIELLKFNPQDNSVEQVRPPDYLILNPVFNIFSDKSGTVWLGNQAWITPEGVWYEVVRSPVFVTLMLESPVRYQWDTPAIVLESSDGRIWFRSLNGMIWLDRQKGEWCWFTTYLSNIVEDSDHNLWMIADGKLYKYALEN